MSVASAFNYQIIRKKNRRTALIRVRPSNQIEVLVPNFISRVQVDEIVRSKKDWILSQFERNLRFQQLHPQKQFIEGESYAFLGETLYLHFLTSADESRCVLSRGLLNISSIHQSDKGFVKVLIQKWYEDAALEYLHSALPKFEKIMNVQAREVKIKDFKSQWGNCSTREVIQFNWKMMMAPKDVVDYIIVHELSHLIHHDHSLAFWRTVSQVIPDYQKRRQWLREHGEGLELEYERS